MLLAQCRLLIALAKAYHLTKAPGRVACIAYSFRCSGGNNHIGAGNIVIAPATEGGKPSMMNDRSLIAILAGATGGAVAIRFGSLSFHLRPRSCWLWARRRPSRPSRVRSRCRAAPALNQGRAMSNPKPETISLRNLRCRNAAETLENLSRRAKNRPQRSYGAGGGGRGTFIVHMN